MHYEVSEYFKVGATVNSWSSQYYAAVDGMPYIENFPKAQEYLCSNWFSGQRNDFWNHKFSFISDLIKEKNSRYKKPFDAVRIKPLAGFVIEKRSVGNRFCE